MLVGFSNSIPNYDMIVFKLIPLLKSDQHHHVLPEQELMSHDSGGVYVVFLPDNRSCCQETNTMASQEDMFTENLAHEEPVNIDGDGAKAEEEESSVVEGVVVGNRKANDFNKKTKRTIAW